MRMFGDKKMPAEFLDPIGGFDGFLVLVMIMAVLIVIAMFVMLLRRLGQMRIRFGGLIEDRWIVAIVKIDVRFGDEITREQLLAVANQHVDHAFGLLALH